MSFFLFENGEKTTVQYKTGVSDGNDFAKFHAGSVGIASNGDIFPRFFGNHFYLNRLKEMVKSLKTSSFVRMQTNWYSMAMPNLFAPSEYMRLELKSMFAMLQTSRVVGVCFELETLKKQMTEEEEKEAHVHAHEHEEHHHGHEHDEAGHGHEHHHHHHHEGGEVEEYGIGTFVYYRRPAFDIHKFDRFIATKWPKNVIRTKGVCYFSHNRDMSYLFEQAGMQKQLREAGLWYATAPEEDLIQLMQQEPGLMRDWDEKYGDRMIKMVFIGQHLDKEQLARDLDECLE